MKKIIIASCLLATLVTSAFAKTPAPVAPRVLDAFSRTHADAENVKWEHNGACSKAVFTVNGQQMFAYYNDGGEQIAVTRNLSITQLPLMLAGDLKAEFKNQWMTELFEISSGGETTYFATLYSATQITVLKADSFGRWSTFKKSKREAL